MNLKVRTGIRERLCVKDGEITHALLYLILWQAGLKKMAFIRKPNNENQRIIQTCEEKMNKKNNMRIEEFIRYAVKQGKGLEVSIALSDSLDMSLTMFIQFKDPDGNQIHTNSTKDVDIDYKSLLEPKLVELEYDDVYDDDDIDIWQ